jgi:hypothetical protein
VLAVAVLNPSIHTGESLELLVVHDAKA